jgi:hypothetical protein
VLLLLKSISEVTDLRFTVNFCMPEMRPSSGLMKGIEVSIAGGSFESCVKRRRAERKTYAAATEPSTKASVEAMVPPEPQSLPTRINTENCRKCAV